MANDQEKGGKDAGTAPAMVQIPQGAIKKPEHANIHAALSAFQGDLKPMAKSGHVEFPSQKGGIVKFDYTPLGDIMSAIYPLLAKHGLAVRHEISEAGIEAILTHSSYNEVESTPRTRTVEDGKEVEQFMSIPMVQNEIRSGIVKLKGAGESMKDTGAAITYARRYTLTMVLGISSEDDKDAELLEGSAKNAQSYAESKARQGIQNATTEAEITKAVSVLKKDLELVTKGKPGALGLTKETYEELLTLAEQKVDEIKNPANIPA